MLPRCLTRSALITLGVFLACACAGSPLDRWHWRNPVPQGNSLLAVTANTERYIAVGDHGTIIISPDGQTWTEQSSGTPATLRGVASGGGRFVAVGDFGTILTSLNGTDWQFASAMTLSTLRGVTYADNSFLVVGDDGLILSSADAMTWSTVHTGPYTLEDVAFGNGLSVAVGGTAPTNRWTDGNAVILTSTNRVDWTAHESGFPSRVYSVCFGMGLFAATTSELDLYTRGVPSVGTSSNGVNWTHYLSPFYLADVASGTDKFVAIGPTGLPIYSYDGHTWITNGQSFPEMRPLAITYGPGGFVAVGLYGAIARSPDGIDWSRMSFLSAYQILDVDYGNGFFLALADSADGGSNIWVSVDGTTWRAHAGPNLGSLTFGNGVFVGSTGDGQIFTTANGIDWVLYQTEGVSLRPETFCDGIFIVGFGSDHEFTSTNGIDWILEPVADRGCQLPGRDDFTSVTFGKGLFVGTTWNAEIWSSRNGQDWILRQEGAPMVTNGLFDLIFSTLYHVAFADGVFIAVGGEGEFGGVYGDKPTTGIIYTSRNGLHWSRAPVRTSDALKRAVYGDGTFVVIGRRSNTILQSEPVPGSTPRVPINGPPGARQ
jgi:hypothetical protein